MSDRLRDALCQLDGVVESESAFKDEPAFWVNGKEIAHFESEHALDVRLTRAQISARRAELRGDPRVILRRGSADWLTVEFHSLDDERFAAGLVEVAAAAHRAPGGSRVGGGGHGERGLTCPGAAGETGLSAYLPQRGILGCRIGPLPDVMWLGAYQKSGRPGWWGGMHNWRR